MRLIISFMLYNVYFIGASVYSILGLKPYDFSFKDFENGYSTFPKYLKLLIILANIGLFAFVVNVLLFFILDKRHLIRW